MLPYPTVKEKMHLQENILFEMLPSALDIMWPLHLQNLKLLRQKVQEEMHLQEKSIFDLDLGVKYWILKMKAMKMHFH